MTGRVLVTLLIMFFMCMYLPVGVYNHSTFISFNLIQYMSSSFFRTKKMKAAKRNRQRTLCCFGAKEKRTGILESTFRTLQVRHYLQERSSYFSKGWNCKLQSNESYFHSE